MIQLFLFPFAGGGVTSFNRLTSHLDTQIETITIEYSGRGDRVDEGYITERKLFIRDVVSQIKKHRKMEVPYALMGYSLGTTVAYEIATNDYLDQAPTHIFFSAIADLRHVNFRRMSDEDFIKHAKTLGGVNARLIENKRLYDLLEHPLKEDYEVIAQYKFSQGCKAITCGTTVFYSEADTPFSTVVGWKDILDGPVEFYEFGSNHFFILEHYREMADIINRILIDERGI